MSILVELWQFMRVRKKFWLLPVVVMMLLFGGLLVLAEGSAVAPFLVNDDRVPGRGWIYKTNGAACQIQSGRFLHVFRALPRQIRSQKVSDTPRPSWLRLSLTATLDTLPYRSFSHEESS